MKQTHPYILRIGPNAALHTTLLWLCVLSFSALRPDIQAQTTDTLRREQLHEVEVSSQRTPATLRVATPTQVVTIEKIQNSGALQVSDALKQLAGVTLKDYGGIGGMKTVSARGLGSQFSAITLDGIPVDNSQNGQVDLGRYVLGNTAFLSFTQGQQSTSLLAAHAYAAGNVLDMETAEPFFATDEWTKMSVGLEGGSYGLFSPSIQWDQRWGKRLKSSLYVNYLHSDGDYPFTLYYSSSHNDSSSVERRKHSAVSMATADGNLFYTIGKGNTWTTKLHYFKGDYELPGPVKLYSQAISGQHSTEELAFIQTRWRMERDRWAGQILAKARYSYDTYLDTTPGSTVIDNTYRQGELFLSGSLHQILTHWLDMDLAADDDLSHLHSNLDQRNVVTRNNICFAASLRGNIGPWEAQVHALYTDVTDRLDDLDTLPTWRRLTPYAALLYKVGDGTTLRFFYKETYRVPNFSELYFFQLIPRDLRPEQAHQVNLGLTHAFTSENGRFSGQLTLDSYYNRVNDKIIAKPTVNLYYWSMQNLGTVDIVGVDIVALLRIDHVEIAGNYSFQSAVDHTDRKSAVYGYQIVYTPRHAGGADLRWENRWVNVGASAMVTGHRYSEPVNSSENRLPAYCEVALNADHRFNFKSSSLTLRATVNNLFDTQYEIVASYPMMGRNWKVGAVYEF